MRNRCYILDGGDGKTCRLKRAAFRALNRGHEQILPVFSHHVPLPCDRHLRRPLARHRGWICATLKPMEPADDQLIALPCASEMVINVLLKVELTWATPAVMFLRSRRRTLDLSTAITLSCLFQSTSSYRQLPWPGRDGCAHWYVCAGPSPADCGDGASPGICPYPSGV